MTGLEIVTQACDACTDYRKFNGALAAETLKSALADEGIPTSGRDVYVRGLDIELDLLVLRPGASPSFNLLYEVGQVKVAVEVKISGVVASGLAITRQNFAVAKAAGVTCCYVAFCDRKNAAATEEKLGSPCFNLTWLVGGGRREDTGDWPRLLEFLRGGDEDAGGRGLQEEVVG